MKGVSHARACARREKPEGGAASLRPPLLFTVICLHPLIQNAENATSPSLASIIEIVHRSSKSGDNGR